MYDMGRRAFITLLGGAASWPLVADGVSGHLPAIACGQSRGFSPVREGSIVAKATTACGFRTVRVGKRGSAQNALAANRAAALGGIGGRVIG